MKITSIRLRISRADAQKLVSTPHGYGHHAAELEAPVEEGESFEQVAAELHRKVDTELRQGRERDKLTLTLDDLREDVRRNEARLASLKADIEAATAVIRSNGKLQALAAQHGIAWNDAGDKLPL